MKGISQAVRFCSRCASELEVFQDGARPRLRCSSCDAVHYEQLKVGAGVLVEDAGRILLLRRAVDPFLNKWSLPNGYVEVDEAPEKAAQRELREELGVDADVGDVFGVYYFSDDPRGNGILIVYRGSTSGSAFTLSDENSEASWFDPGTVPRLAGGGHDRAVQDWLSRGKDSER